VTLKVVVLVKQVPDHEAAIQVVSEQELDIEKRYVCSYFDEVAIEAALALQKAHEVELVALAAGSKHAVDALRRAVAMGIDRVEQIEQDNLAQSDSLAVAHALASRLKVLEPDLVLCGKQGGDDEQAAVGPMVAQLMEIPHVSAAVSLSLDPANSSATVERMSEGEVWTLQTGLPLLVSAEKGLAEPHVPVVTRVMKAMKAKIEVVPVEPLLDLPDTEIRMQRLRYLPPPTRPPVKMLISPFPGNVAELVDALGEAGVLPGKGDPS
jgi:electron transfer flavoprotein beta subunit